MTWDVSAVRRQFPFFVSLEQPYHYLDSAATAQMHGAVFESMRRHDTIARGNVLRGNHRLAEAASVAFDSARGSVARFLNAAGPEEVVFTSGCTSAINLVAGALAHTLRAGDEVLVSAAEHHSNFLPWQRLRERGIVLRVLPVDRQGRIVFAAIAEQVGARCRMIALTHASNVTGALTTADEIAATVGAAHAVGARVLLDGAQRAPHGPLNVQALGIDFYAFSGHKCFGPTGIGALWGRRDALADLPPFMSGGGMIGNVSLEASTWAEPPRRFEAGTPPIAQAVGLGAALEWMMSLPWQLIRAHEQGLLETLLRELPAIPGLEIVGPTDAAERLPVVAFRLEGLHSHDVCQVLDSQGVAVRGGHHCAQPLHQALGVDETVRASFSLYSDAADVGALLAALRRARQVLA